MSKQPKISPHISYKEAIYSQTAVRKGLDNTPSSVELDNMKYVATECFEPIRNHFGRAIPVSSFFRNKKVNAAIGGSSTSDHIKGFSIDMDVDVYDDDTFTNKHIFEWAKENLVFDQLIWEFGDDDNPAWVHISKRKGHNRGEVKKILKGTGYTLLEIKDFFLIIN